MNVLFCAYRNWALDIYSEISKKFENHTFDLVSDESLVKKALERKKYELIFFVGWSWIVDQAIIEEHYCICLHPSPLPKYRGGSPIQNQIINGETNSAVTLFKMDELIDHGPVIFQQEISLSGRLGDIFLEISRSGTRGITSILENFPNIQLVTQNENEASYFQRRKSSMSEITIQELQKSTSLELHNKVRSLQQPYPLPYIICADGKKLFILETALDD